MVGQRIGDRERAIAMIARWCESGDLPAAYRSSTGGAAALDSDVWHLPHWRNYFIDGTIDLDLPLLVRRGGAIVATEFTARCTREIFVREQRLRQLVDALSAAVELAQSRAPKPKPGRKEKSFWPQVEKHIIEDKFGYYGPLGADQPGWESQADVEKAITDFLSENDLSAAESTIRARAKQLISKYARIEAGKAGN
jgi:hypothetical protein